MEEKFVSVIVPTYNRKEDLKKCLYSLLSVDYPKDKYEIIVIDDGSTDGTFEFMKNISHKYGRLIKYHRQNNSGPAKARNLGIKKAKGEIIFFVDDDVLVPKDFIKKSLKWYRNKKVAGVGGKVIPKKLSWPDLYYIARSIDEFLYLIKVNRKLKRGIATALCSYRKNVLIKLGGFDENFPLAAGEDIDLTRRVVDYGFIVIKDPSIIGEHLRSENFISILKLKFKRMSGAVIHRIKDNDSVEKVYAPSRIFKQWRNFKIAKRKFLNKEVNFFDFLKFIYLTLALAFVSKIGEIYYSRKLKRKILA